MTGKDFIRKIFSPYIWINVLGMSLVIILVCLGTIWWMQGYTHHGEGVDVPNVKGILFDDAVYELRDLELDAIVIDSSYDKRLAPGIVIEQTPGPGARIKAGREVYLTINAKSEPTMPIPNVIDNCSYREAEAKFLALGFKMAPVQYVEGTKDWVLGVKCQGRSVRTGDRVPLSSPITLVIGNSEVEFDENETIVDDNWMNDEVVENGDITGDINGEVF